MKNYFVALVLLFITLSCQKQAPVDETYIPDVENMFPYQLEHYSSKFKVPSRLTEISGISDMGNGLIATIQDEDGIVFIYSLTEEKVVREIKFAKSGDYEDIEIVGNIAYVLRSDGNIYKIDDFDGANIVSVIETPLKSKNDTEGMCYDRQSNSLWIACKSAAGIGKRIAGLRSVYAFDLTNEQFIEQPVIKVDLERLSEVGETNVPFEPSGIAIHPITGDKYLISSVGRVLLVLDSQNEIKHLRSLRQKGFKQPEGICFTKNGNMYLSNEGKGGKGNILKFNYIE